MNISGIRNYSGVYDYNSIKVQEAAKHPLQSAPVAEEVQEKPQELQDTNVGVQDDKRSYTAYDFAGKYQPVELFHMKGADSDIHDLDVTKAISDMQKDQVLQQYQIFVGDNSSQGQANGGNDAEISGVRAIENFSL